MQILQEQKSALALTVSKALTPASDLTSLRGFIKEALINVIPAQAGIHHTLMSLDPRLRRGDEAGIDQRFLK